MSPRHGVGGSRNPRAEHVPCRDLGGTTLWYHCPMATTAPTVTASNLKQRIAADLAYLIALRHDLHACPELGYEERQTSARIQKELAAAGVAFKAGLAGTGVVAHLPATEDPEPGAPSRAVALRADIDALPIEEATGKPYTSTNPGLMHACGHDGHTTILLGAARALAGMPRPRPVTFIFQPAEENGAGGKAMCEAGALEGEAGGGLGPPVEAIFGLHGWPTVPVGVVATRPGPLLAATDEFCITVRGMGGHAAYPHQARDPIVAAAAVVTALQTLASRCINPVEPVVCTVGRIGGGVATNIIPGEVELEGTVRTLSDQTRDVAKQRLFELAELTARAHGCEAEVEWHEGYPATRNDEALTERFLNVARRAMGEGRVQVTPTPTMGGEDFSYYGHRVPACFFLLGIVPEGQDPALVPQLHQPDFDFNDDAIAVGVELMCRVALE
jgi:amidohydrolase